MEQMPANRSVTRIVVTRPKRSETDPHNGWLRPYARKYTPAACTTEPSGTCRSSAIATSIGGIANRSNVATNAPRCSSPIAVGRLPGHGHGHRVDRLDSVDLVDVDKPRVLRQRRLHRVASVDDQRQPGRAQGD